MSDYESGCNGELPVQQETSEKKLLQALQFCLDMAEEEYPHQQYRSPGAEVCLRHIVRKCRETLAEHHGESP